MRTGTKRGLTATLRGLRIRVYKEVSAMTIQDAITVLSNLTVQSPLALSVQQHHAICISLAILRSLRPDLEKCYDALIAIEHAVNPAADGG